MIEWFGTAMSVLVAISLMQKNIKTLRIINLLGAAGFATYGFIINAWPVFGLNAFIALIDLYYLIEMAIKKDFFSYITGDLQDSTYAQRFLEFYRSDWSDFFPDYYPKGEEKYCLILRNMVPVSIILYKEENKDQALISLDYATPQYRDFKNAQFFLSQVVNKDSNFCYHSLHTRARNPKHARYLEKLGYQQEGDDYFWRLAK